MRKHLLILFISLITVCTTVAQVNAQTRVTGKILDSQTKEPLIGASVLVKGTSVATSASLNGTFKITVPAGGTTLVISYVGYITKEVEINGKTDLGTIEVPANNGAMKEVQVTGDVAVDRKTPIAVSTINEQFIEDKIGNQDIPELLSTTPGVMATAQGGGYGDSRISIRGFSSAGGKGNVALTINGIPVNDMESGGIFWSDFTGLTDVTRSIQIQRGLGAAKIIVPSFGGTINIATRTTDAVQGGYISQTIGSDGYDKTSVLISTGLNKGWAATFAGARNVGNGNADGLSYSGYNYFFNLAKVLTPNQTLSFTVAGATQTHGQRPEEPIVDYQNAPQGVRWNYQNGIKDGAPFNPYNNFFSKPIFSLNHDWNINDKSSLATVLYATYGTGGAGGISGTVPRVAGTNIYTPFDYTAVEKSNATTVDGSAATYLYASHNDHVWYGLRSTYRTLIGKHLDLSAGVDGRYYYGNHYQVVTDLLGANYVTDNYKAGSNGGSGTNDINNPVYRALVGDKINYYNKDQVEYGGGYAQAEYTKDNFTLFATFSAAEEAVKRTDYFNYLNGDPNQTSPWVKFFTYQAKGGANYNINDQMNVFANIGYITKPPFFDKGVFENFTNKVNGTPVDEKLFSYELGYQYKISQFSAKLNLYHSLYSDITNTTTFFDNATNDTYTANITGVTELHQGAELELRERPIRAITFTGFLSLGDWHYTKNAGPSSLYNSANTLLKTIPVVYLQGIKTGDAAQTTAGLGLDIDVLPQLRIGSNYFYYGNYTSNFVFTNITSAGLTPYKIPNYSLLNLNASFRFKLAGLDASLIGNVFNVLNTVYIADGYDPSASGLAQNTSAYYGLGRTFTTGLKIKF